MKKSKLFIMALCATLVLDTNAEVPVHAEKTQEKTSSYVVIAETTKAATKVEHLVDDLDVVQTLSGQGEKIYVAEMTENEADTLENDRKISVEPNVEFNATGQTGNKEISSAIRQLHKEDWASKAVHCENKKAGRDTIRVAIMDSGVDIESDVNVTRRIDFVDDYYQNTDGSGHGTMVTHIVAEHSTDYGTEGIISPDSNVELISIRILDKDNKAPLSRVLEALQWCIDNDVDIVNMSFGTDFHSEVFYHMIQETAKNNVLMIAAVGNKGEMADTSVQYPAKYSQVIGVGSIDEHMTRSTFSSYGDGVAIVAPGENIPISSYMGMVGVGSGTSYAAPYVTAAAALLWSSDHAKDAEYVRAALEQGADSLGSILEYGHGILDYEKSYQLFVTNQVNCDYRNDVPDKIIQEYEVPECVQGSWGYQLHQELIVATRANGADNKREIYAADRDMIREMAVYVDQNAKMKTYDVLHARGETNYVSATKWLFEASRKWGGSIKSQTQLKNSMKQYKDGGKNESESIRQLMHIAEMATTKIIEGKNSSKNICKHKDASEMTKSQINRGRMQLLGVAIHIAGDTYAHKSICVKNKFRDISKAKYYDKTTKATHTVAYYMNTNVDKIEKYIGEGNLTTARLGQKYFTQANICNIFYTDTKAYMTARYDKATANATAHLLKKYVKNETFTIYTFCPYKKDANYPYKTKFWSKCMKQVDEKYIEHMKDYDEKKLNELSRD